MRKFTCVPAPRFLCDRMFVRLGRWLRAAGYDTLIAEDGDTDSELLARAKRERRLLLTGDRELATRPEASGHVLGLNSSGLEASAAELGRLLELDWLARPFTRCLECNTRLVRAPPAALALVPEQSRPAAGVLKRCPRCGRLYWEGGHVRRMRNRLRQWQEAQALRP